MQLQAPQIQMLYQLLVIIMVSNLQIMIIFTYKDLIYAFLSMKEMQLATAQRTLFQLLPQLLEELQLFVELTQVITVSIFI